MTTVTTTDISPLPGEIQVDHYSRVFPLLSGTTEEKNAEILAAWEDSEEAHELDEIADRKFPADKFSRGVSVPVFTEHETVRKRIDASGNVIEEPVKWDRDRLAAMCYQMNHRIRDTGSFSPITEGHTPDKHARDKGCPQPAVLGYQGKFRMGLIGNLDPKWTIFCDEYRHIEDADKFSKLTRRSPEVWSSAEKPFFDPCAALGAETPRLDMGTALAYSHDGYWQSVGDDGATIDKYSMGVPTFAGPGNVTIPTQVPKENYEANGNEPDGDESDQIVSAVMEALGPALEIIAQIEPLLPALQKLAVKSELPPKEETTGAVANQHGQSGPAAPDAPAPAAPVNQPGQPNPQPQASTMPQELAEDDKNMMTKYMAGQCSETDLRAHRDAKRKPAPSMYSKASPIEQAERYQKLSELRDKGYEFELDGELKLTASYTPDQFATHCSKVVTRYSRLPIGGPNLPTLDDDPTPLIAKRIEDITEKDRDEVVKYAMQHSISNFKQAFDALKADRAKAPAASVR